MSPGAAGLLFALAAGLASAQVPDVRVYSEFTRIDPAGKVVSPDRPRRADVRPREILSPGLARNAHAIFHIAITVPPGMPFSLYVGQNPEDFLGVTVYRELYVQRGAEWIPDGLEPVELPYSARLPDASRPIPGQTMVTFLMDVWVAPDTAVRRSKLEPEVFVDGRWIIYPMEARVLSAVVPEIKNAGGAPADLENPSDATARAALLAYLCGAPSGGASDRGNIRWQILRAAAQDMALARTLESPPGARLLPEILRLAGAAGSAAKWCKSPVFPEDLGPEWYLRIRDALYHMLN